MGTLKHIDAGDLCIAYEESGNVDGTTVILMHGFPYDIRHSKTQLRLRREVFQTALCQAESVSCNFKSPNLITKKKMTNSKLTFNYIAISIVAVFATFFFHELFHWITGELLGYKMTMTLNSVSLTEGKYLKSWHETLVSVAGPIFTILQASIFYIVMRQNKNLLLYPFLFAPLYMRILAGALNFINLNDEGRISNTLGIGTFTLSIFVCILLLFFVFKISKQNNYTTKFQIKNLLLTMLFSSILILADQFLHLKIIN